MGTYEKFYSQQINICQIWITICEGERDEVGEIKKGCHEEIKRYCGMRKIDIMRDVEREGKTDSQRVGERESSRMIERESDKK